MKPKNWPWWRIKAINLQEFRRQLYEKLRQGRIDAPENTSLILLCHVLDQPKSWILAHGDYVLNQEETQILKKYQSQLLEGTPLPYLLGLWEFYGRRFKITPDVLIPRPETEILVERAIQCVKDEVQPKIADVGTGSGAIAVTLAAEQPAAQILATDISRPALKIAKINAGRYAKTRIHFVQSHLLKPIYMQFDLICANLPYIPTNTLQGLDVLEHEPRVALDGGESGVKLIEELLNQAQTRLKPWGTILLEIEATLGKQVLALAQSTFSKAQVNLHQDLAGKDRLVEIRQP